MYESKDYFILKNLVGEYHVAYSQMTCDEAERVFEAKCVPVAEKHLTLISFVIAKAVTFEDEVMNPSERKCFIVESEVDSFYVAEEKLTFAEANKLMENTYYPLMDRHPEWPVSYFIVEKIR